MSSSHDELTHDVEITLRLQTLQDKLLAFAASSPPGPVQLDRLLLPTNEHSVAYLALVAQSGPKAADGWVDLLAGEESRRALIVAVISHALKAHVFDELYFGASKELKDKLTGMEVKGMGFDGFVRARRRAEAIKAFSESIRRAVDAGALSQAIDSLAARIEPLISPLWSSEGSMSEDARSALSLIVRNAAGLARRFRCSRQGEVFFSPPTIKDSLFNPALMECSNLSSMLELSPYSKTADGTAGVLDDGGEERRDALVQIVCFPAFVLFHGRGDVSNHDLKTKKKSGDSDESGRTYSSQLLCKATVFLAWGRQKLKTCEAGTAPHLKALREGDERRYSNQTGKYASKDLWSLYLERNGFVAANREVEEEWSAAF